MKMSKKSLLEKQSYTVQDLRDIMEILRSDGGCPWDREQTHQSIRNEFLEEAYEAVEGIDRDDAAILKEELGDVLLQVVFHARISEEAGEFNLDDVADGICKKLILRHPHVFADTSADTSAEVLRNWDEIKKTEKHQTSASDTLRGVSQALPALMRSQKLQKKAAKVGFTFADTAGAMEKAQEEWQELRRALEEGNRDAVCEELGDVLFALANVARLEGIDAEEALFRSNDKFLCRFSKMEELSQQEGRELNEQSVNKMLAFWELSKKM